MNVFTGQGLKSPFIEEISSALTFYQRRPVFLRKLGLVRFSQCVFMIIRGTIEADLSLKLNLEQGRTKYASSP